MSSRTRRPCTRCGTIARGNLCGICMLADHPHASPETLDKGGRWVTERGIQRWLSVEDEIRRYERARMAPLMAERYGECGWWTRHGDLFHDKPEEIAQRMRDLVAEFDAADGRVGETAA